MYDGQLRNVTIKMVELLTGAAITALSAIGLAIVKRSRCKLILRQKCFSFGIGFTEVPLHLPTPKRQESAEEATVNAKDSA